ncbi:bifunctional 2-C-methyl-D-erythritol 4-phosphate cytidylyltransferase/2-C-methyl-D-erythritol 2,4-cyclodiphosphate synthase [Okibacterium endophyticum]
MRAEPEIAVIVVAAGSGSRLGADKPKAFVACGGRTLLERALYSVLGMQREAQVIAVVPFELVGEAERMCSAVAGHARDSVSVVAGGDTRQLSVSAGLAAISSSVRTVLVHDAARALTPAAQFERVTDAVEARGHGVVPGVPVSDTIKSVDEGETVTGTVDRSVLRAVQTPQGFPRDALVDAYRRASREYTDDAALFADAGHQVDVVAGDPQAFKITTPWDLQRAENLVATTLPAERDQRTGVGIDVHAYDDTAQLWLAGLFWPGEPGLAGHSDGDVVCHAITDALLSAAGLGDIGSVFGTDDPAFSGAHGEVFVRRGAERLGAAGFRIQNVAVQLIGNSPRLAGRRHEAEGVLSSWLGAPVSLSATTADGLGFTGRGEGVCAIATALIRRQ